MTRPTPTPTRTSRRRAAAAPFCPISTTARSNSPSPCRRITPCSPSCSTRTRACGCGRRGTSATAAAWCWCLPTRITPTISGWLTGTGPCSARSPTTARPGTRCRGRSRPGGADVPLRRSAAVATAGALTVLRPAPDGYVSREPAPDRTPNPPGPGAALIVTGSFAERPDNRVADTCERAWQDSSAHRGETHSADPQELKIEVTGEKSRHRRASEAADVVTVANGQDRRLAARQQQQAVVQSREIRGGHHENASRLQHPPRFPQGPAEVLHRDQVAVPDHQVKIA